MGSIDFETIRALNPIDEFCARRGIRLRCSGSLGESVGLCPFHREETGSFTVYPDGHAHCFGCGRHHRDVIDLCADLDGLELREAARKLSDLRTFSSGRVTKPTERQRETNSQPYILTDADIKRMAAGARRLAEDDALIKRLVTKRPEWTADAVHQVARDGDLGIEDGKMLFNYRYGIKARWKDENGN